MTVEKRHQDVMAAMIRRAELYRRDEFGHFLALREQCECLNGYFAELVDAVDAYYMSIPAPSNPPFAVRRAVCVKFAENLELAEKILATLGYDGICGCWYFNYAGMFHGVEPDGYIHT